MRKVFIASIILALLITSNAFAVRGYVGNFVQKGVNGKDVTAYGAKGDGVTDDTQAFIDAITAAAGGTVYVPAGNYIIVSPINEWDLSLATTLRKGTVLQGKGPGESIIQYTGTTGYCLDLYDTDDLYNSNGVHGVTIRDLHFMCPNITSVDVGGAIRIDGSLNTVQNCDFTYCTTATTIAYVGREVGVDEDGDEDGDMDGVTPDTYRELGDSGTATYRYAQKFTTNSLAYRVKYATVTLRKIGAPTGNLHFEIWTDDGGSPSAPNAQINASDSTEADSDDLDVSTISTSATDYEIEFIYRSDFFDAENYVNVSASTDYWLVIESEYTLYNTGVNAIQVYVDNDGGSNEFATYDDTGGGWSVDADDGINFEVRIWPTAGFGNKIVDCRFRGSTGDVGQAILNDGNIIYVDKCYIDADSVVHLKAGTLSMSQCYFVSSGSTPLDLLGNSSFEQCWWEVTNPSYIRGYCKYSFTDCIFGGSELVVDGHSEIMCTGDQPDWDNYDPQVASLSNRWKYRILTASAGKWNDGGGGTLVTDATALDGNAIELTNQNQSVQLNWRPSSSVTNIPVYYAERLPAGCYRITWYIKTDSPSANDLDLVVFDDRYNTVNDDYIDYTTTTSYAPYTCFLRVQSADITDSPYWMCVYAQKKSTAGTNTMWVSHCEVEYMGPDRVHITDKYMVNPTEEDTDDGRSVSLSAWGRDSNGVQVEQGKIRFSHDGSSTDATSKVEIVVNNDSVDAVASYVPAAFSSSGMVSTAYNYAADTASDDDYLIALDPAPAAYTTGMMIVFKAVTANTGACTVNVNSLGAKNLLMLHDQTPANSYIEAGSIVMAVYDGTSFQLISPDNNP